MCLWRRDWRFAPTIRYQFKRRLFSRRPCTGPHLWAGPHSRLQRLANCVSFSFNLLVINPRRLAILRRSSRNLLSRPIQLCRLNRLAMTGPAMLIRMPKIPNLEAISMRSCRRNERGLALFRVTRLSSVGLRTSGPRKVMMSLRPNSVRKRAS